MKPKNKTFDERVVDDNQNDKPVKKMPKKGMRRVVKERITKDQKGYNVVEEYSSYEEMTPEEIA